MKRAKKRVAVKTVAAAKTRRLAATDWVDAALVTMARRGVANVRVELLARDLKVTKGSFYWHFKDRNALLDAMLVRYKELSTGAGRLAAGESSDVKSALQLLRDMLEAPQKRPDAAEGARMELAIRLWARRSDHVHELLLDLDATRRRDMGKLVAIVGGKPRDVAMKTHLLQAVLFHLWTRDDLAITEREGLIDLLLNVLSGK